MISPFSKIGISTRTILPLALLALVALAAGGMSSRTLMSVDAAYGDMVDQDRLAATNTNRLVLRAVDLARSVWLSAAVAEPAEIARSLQEVEAIDRDVTRLVSSIRDISGDSAIKADLDTMVTSFAALRTTAMQALGMLRDGRAAEARALLRVDFQSRVNGLRDVNRHMSATIEGAAQARSDALTAQSAASARNGLLLLGGGIALSLGLGIWITQSTVLRPLHRLDAAMQRLVAGDFGAAVGNTERHDAIGRMARALKGFAASLGQVATLRAEQDAARLRAEQDRRATMQDLANSLETSVGDVVQSIADAAGELNGAATLMVGIADQTNRRAGMVSAATIAASDNVSTVAAASEELAVSGVEIGRQLADGARMAAAAVDQAARTNGTVTRLTEAAGRIGEVTRLIGDIAGQTNLLALNATIEAARAGEAGKGFAVVASEVKTLANQTAQATGSIATQIQAMQEAAREAAADIGLIRDSIAQINEMTGSIAAAVGEQGAATRDIAQNVQRAAAGTLEITAAIDGVTQAAGETGSAAGRVQATSGSLAGQAELLRHEVGAFLGRIRAA